MDTDWTSVVGYFGQDWGPADVGEDGWYWQWWLTTGQFDLTRCPCGLPALPDRNAFGTCEHHLLADRDWLAAGIRDGYMDPRALPPNRRPLAEVVPFPGRPLDVPVRP